MASSSKKQEPPIDYFHPEAQCGVCREDLPESAEVVVILGKFHQRQMFDITRPAAWGAQERPGLRRTWVLRSQPRDGMPEAVTLHTECYQLFRRHCRGPDALSRLWSFAAMQKPWPLRGQEPLLLTRSALSIPGPGLKEVCSHLELADLAGMPQELVGELETVSQTSLVWRMALAIGLGQMMMRLPGDSFRQDQLPLSAIKPWKRDGPPPTSSHEETAGLPIIRITMDILGISEVERFAEGELTTHPLEAVGQRLYLVVRASSVSNLTAIYMLDRLRFENPPRSQLWDISVPPMLPAVEESPISLADRHNTFIKVGRRYPHEHFATVKLEKNLTGLTFIYDNCGGSVRAVHGHTAQTPVAQCYGHPEADDTKDLIYLYVPLAAGDHITAIGALEKPTVTETLQNEVPSSAHQILIETALSGTVSVGPLQNGRDGPLLLSREPTMLITSKKTRGPYTMLGAYPRPLFNSLRMQQQNPVPNGMIRYLQSRKSFFSRASLEKVVSTRVFVSDTATFLGAIFKYENGTEAAVGECRVGLVEETVCESPGYICLTAPLPWSSICECNFRQYITQVRFVQHMCPGDQGCCHPMIGELRFWLNDIDNLVLLFRPKGTPSAGLPVSVVVPEARRPSTPPVDEGLAVYGPIWVPGQGQAQAEIKGMAYTEDFIISNIEKPLLGDAEPRAMAAHANAVEHALIGIDWMEPHENPMATALVNGKPAGRRHTHETMVEPESTSAEAYWMANAEGYELALTQRRQARAQMHAQLLPLVEAGNIQANQAEMMADEFAFKEVPMPLTVFDYYSETAPLARVVVVLPPPRPVNQLPPQIQVQAPSQPVNHAPPGPAVAQAPPPPASQAPPEPELQEIPGPAVAGPSRPETAASGSRKRSRERVTNDFPPPLESDEEDHFWFSD